jgi:putative DNA primase/helicase
MAADILSLLDGVRRSGDGFIAKCPAHDDRKPSLSVTFRDNRALLKCFSGCDTADVVHAMGLEFRDLFTEPGKAPRRHAKGRADFNATWNAADPCEIHPYLSAKRVRSYGLRQDSEGLLLVPMRDIDGEIWGLQRIWRNGDKKHMRGSKVRGHFFQIGELGAYGKQSTHLIICEGYATGATVYEALGWMTIVAFDAGNLEPVAGNLRRVYPNERFVFAADNDRHTSGNPGVTRATAAAKSTSGIAVWPSFRSGDNGSDWNDAERLYGMEVVEMLYGY